MADDVVVLQAAKADAAKRYLPAAAAKAPRPIVFDADYATDVDDGAALRMLLCQARIGAVDLRCVLINSTATNAARAASAHLIDEERSDVPIGQIVVSGTPPTAVSAHGTQIDAIVDEYQSNTSFPNSVTLARTELASRKTADLTWLCTGFLNTLAQVLQSPGDAISPLTGAQLFAKAVKRVVVMGGAYLTSTAETNFAGDVTSTAYVLANCPVHMEFKGIDNSWAIGTILNTVERTDLLRRQFEVQGVLTNGRAGHDPLAALIALTDDPTTVGFTATVGTNTVDTGTGINTFTASPTGPHTAWVDMGNHTTLQVGLVDAMLVPGYEPVATGKSVLRPLAARKTPWTPYRLANTPGTWLRGDDLTGASGASIASWPQAYGVSAGAASQATPAAQPTVARGIRELLAANFNGSQYIDVAASSVRLLRPLFFIVCTAGNPGTYQTPGGVPYSGTLHTTPFYNYAFQIAPTLYVRTNYSANTAGSIVRSWSSPRLLETHGPTRSLWVDGSYEAQNLTTSGSLSYANASPLRIGANGAGAEGLVGLVYEVLVLDAAKTTAGERAQVREYFRRKYNLGLSPA